MKILISIDMEGISGVVNWGQTETGNSDYERFRVVMTDEANAAISGAFSGGADEVVVTDSHGGGLNILIEKLDKRASLNSGLSSPYSMMQGIEKGDISGVMFIGYHARSGSQNAVLAHTWSASRIANVWLNEVLVGEYGLNAALAGHFGTPIILVAGDQTACAQATELLGKMETVVVKQATGFESALCLPPEASHVLIKEAAHHAVSELKSTFHQPFLVEKPVRLTVEFTQPVHADRAARLPFATRLDARKLEFTFPDMVIAHAAFRSAVRVGAD